MTDKEIVMAAKTAEKKTEFGELVHSKVSRGVNSAYGIGFLEGAEWTREQMMKDAVEGEVKDFCFVREVNYSSAKIEFSTIPELKFGDKVRVIVLKAEEE